MIIFTQQERRVLLFLAVSIFCGSLFLLLKKQYPELMRVLNLPMEQIVQYRIDINSATQEQWESLPMIGAFRAEKIIAEREARGRFKQIEDVRYVKGIGPYVFNRIRPYLRRD